MKAGLDDSYALMDLADLDGARLIIIGYAARDEKSVRHHIDELAKIGVAPPPEVPMLYELDAELVTTAPSITVGGPQTSGEVEPVLIRSKRRWYLSVGSDHTDRDMERDDVWSSKAACAKPVADKMIALPDGVEEGSFDSVWDRCVMRSTADGDDYQAGTLLALRQPSDIIARVRAYGDDEAETLVLFAGTLPILDGVFRPSESFFGEIDLGQGTALDLSYRVHRV